MIRIIPIALLLMAGFVLMPQPAFAEDETKAEKSLIEKMMSAITGGDDGEQSAHNDAPVDSEVLGSMPITNEVDAPLVQAMPRTQVTIEATSGTRYLFNVEMATTETQRERGLMGRASLRQDEGMIFIFPVVREQSFWMKDTLIPLDIIFISEAGIVEHIHHNAVPQDRSLITAPKPVKAVVEINGGLSDKLGFEVGSVVYHDIFNNMNLMAPTLAQDQTPQ